MPQPHPPPPSRRAVVAELRVRPPDARLALTGELDLVSADQVRAALDAVGVAPVEVLEIDLSAVEFASLATLGELVAFARALEARGGRVVVRGARPLQRRVLVLLEAPDAMVVVGDDAG